MPEIYNFSEAEILGFFLVLARMSAFVVSWPVFGTPLVPSPVKVLFALVASMVLFPTVAYNHLNVELISSQIIWMIVREVFIGLTLGYIARFFFFAIGMAGQVISLSMGISSAQLFNPALGAQSSAMEQVYVALATLFFLAINGHHIFIGGLVESYNVVPLDALSVSLTGLGEMGVMVQQIMEIAVKLCAPVLVSILFMNLAMAVIGRTVPQINVLITSLPVNILVGYVVIFVSLPLLVWQMNDLLDLTAERLFQILKSF